jgi:hypothetical protein
LLVLEPLLPTGLLVWTVGQPNVNITLTWPVAMNQTIRPRPSNFVMTLDGFPVSVFDTYWLDSTTFVLSKGNILTKPTTAKLQYIPGTYKFTTLTGELAPAFTLDPLPIA